MGEVDRPQGETEWVIGGGWRNAARFTPSDPALCAGPPSPSRGRTWWRHARSSLHTLNLRHPTGTAQRASGGPRLAGLIIRARWLRQDDQQGGWGPPDRGFAATGGW